MKKGESIFCHYKLLKEAMKLGAVVEVVSGISFRQKYLFRDYIAVLAKLRANTTNEAHARFEDDSETDAHRSLHDDRTKCIRQNVANKD